jgi:hypothetical protein
VVLILSAGLLEAREGSLDLTTPQQPLIERGNFCSLNRKMRGTRMKLHKNAIFLTIFLADPSRGDNAFGTLLVRFGSLRNIVNKLNIHVCFDKEMRAFHYR